MTFNLRRSHTLLLMPLLLLAGCGESGSSQSAPTPAFTRQGDRLIVPATSALRKQLRVEAARLDDISNVVLADAVVESDPRRTARITPPFAGRITRLNVQLGDRVGSGQVLAVMSAPEAGTASADLRKAQAQLAVASTARKRAHELRAIGGIADRDVEQAEAEHAVAVAERDRAAEAARVLGVGAGGQVVIRAPVAGSVIELAASPGTLVADTAANLMTVADLGTVWVNANVTEGDIDRVRVGQEVMIRLASNPQAPLTGRVAAVADVLDPETRRAKVRIIVSNRDHRLKPGMFATVEIRAAAVSAVTVPPSALVLRDDRTRVFVEERPFVFVPRTVVTGQTVDGRTVITQGLRPDERVVSAGGVYLND
ncbi:efflux RND transporter periplasmic adaptor subunit [Brevundimonas diminuta]|uniref:efflux RND transporter periplasmic adaptor subunit n=1 Tax=Brevundimonas diminuta TaxID=293 RepID=UPI0022AFC4FC|nr:efflux RND transporter periplasmic adaptor subunit [Brevundimonas diminuta]MCZ4107047.1 efflux RND transporter periplasmic adaptor subunit [Brevundimonas diminuta]